MAAVICHVTVSVSTTLLLLCSLITTTTAITQMPNLLWTEKELFDGTVNIKGIPGDPSTWVNKSIQYYSISYFTDPFSRSVSHRVALAFRYNSRRLFFTDRGFKEVFEITLANTTQIPYIYNVTLNTVYSGTSTQVNGLACDWISGSLYWTDALYNWITVANSSALNIYNHIVVTELDQPMGIAVYPQRGIMFWSDVGAVPKIERSSLSGTQRMNFIDTNVDKPLGLTIDYTTDRLYWVDDVRDTVEWCDMMAENRQTIALLDKLMVNRARLFGIAVFHDYIFFSDQIALSIRVFNKTSTSYICDVDAGIFSGDFAIPYDVMMYDPENQLITDSDCTTLSCSDICISDGGSAGHCICRNGYVLDTDNQTCIDNGTLIRPAYLYSIGHELCSTDVNTADLIYAAFFVDCFLTTPNNVMNALAFHNYADLFYFSDLTQQVIHRMRLDVAPSTALLELETVAANTGTVTGMAVDWIADNLYWMNGDTGNIMVSRLTGRFPRILIRNIQDPRSLGVCPQTGTLYWTTVDTIFVSNMDGTDIRELIYIPGADFDGLVLDIVQDTLLWVDNSLPGIRMSRLNGTELDVMLQSVDNDTSFRDVTVYEEYISWTTGYNSIFFGVRNFDNDTTAGALRSIQHVGERTSHDIITFDAYLQPLLEPGVINPCNVDNDVISCSQLCLLTPGLGQARGLESSCGCAYGFELAPNGYACISYWMTDNFLLFIDPVQKSMYELKLAGYSSNGTDVYDYSLLNNSTSNTTTGNASYTIPSTGLPSPNLNDPQGVSLRSSNQPCLSTYDLTSGTFYWFDKDQKMNSIKMMSYSDVDKYENSIATLTKEVVVNHLDSVPNLGLVVYTDSRPGGAIYLLDPATEKSSVLPAAASIAGLFPTALTVDPFTGDIYWVNGSFDGVEGSQTVYKCSTRSGGGGVGGGIGTCMQAGGGEELMQWKGGETIEGITIDIINRNLVVWTNSTVFRISSDFQTNTPIASSSSSSSSLSSSNSSFINFTSVVVVGSFVYCTDGQAVYKIDEGNGVMVNITEPVFSQLTDLKVYIAHPPSPPQKGLVGPSSLFFIVGLSTPILAALIAGCALILLLLLFIILIIVVAVRRRKKHRSQFRTAAHDNPTYISHRQVTGLTVTTIVTQEQATGGVIVYDEEKEKKEKLPIDDDNDSCYKNKLNDNSVSVDDDNVFDNASIKKKKIDDDEFDDSSIKKKIDDDEFLEGDLGKFNSPLGAYGEVTRHDSGCVQDMADSSLDLRDVNLVFGRQKPGGGGRGEYTLTRQTSTASATYSPTFRSHDDNDSAIGSVTGSGYFSKFH